MNTRELGIQQSLAFPAWVWALMIASLLFLRPTNASEPLSDNALAQIRFDQRLNNQVSLDLAFRDETGREVRLGQYFGQTPVVLVLGYYKCPMLCTLVLNALLESAADMKWSIGREFGVVDVSVDPNETPELAAAKKRTYAKRYGRLGTAQGWHFLTGSEPAIRQLASEVGFHYAYDTVSREYAHPSGLIILTPEGKVSGYQFGVSFPSKDLYESLLRASTKQIGSPIRQFILLCFHYNPLTGKYSGMIMVCLRCFAAATLLGMVWLVVSAARRRRVTEAYAACSASQLDGPSDSLRGAATDPRQSPAGGPGLVSGVSDPPTRL